MALPGTSRPARSRADLGRVIAPATLYVRVVCRTPPQGSAAALTTITTIMMAGATVYSTLSTPRGR